MIWGVSVFLQDLQMPFALEVLNHTNSASHS